MTKKEFIALEANKAARKNILVSAILCYISGGITLAAAMFIPEMGAGLLDAIILIALGLIIHLTKSFAASVVLLVYSLVNIVYLLVTTGRIGGWLLVIAGIFATIETYKLRKAWKVCQNNPAGMYAAQPYQNQPYTGQPYQNQPYQNQPYQNQPVVEPYQNPPAVEPYQNPSYPEQPYTDWQNNGSDR